MWLTTPRFLVGAAVLCVLMAIAAVLEIRGELSHDDARLVYGAACLVLLAAIAWRARARWRGWRERQDLS